jgi:hypothetical protein
MSKAIARTSLVTDERDWLGEEGADPTLDLPSPSAQREHERIQGLRDRLDRQSDSRRAIYQQLVLCAYDRIEHAPARLLCVMANLARADLSNYFLLRRTLMTKVGIRSLPTLVTQLRRLEEGGWILRHRHVKENGQRSSAGVQFRLPAGILGNAWEGPVDFSNRRKTRDSAGRPVGIIDQFLEEPAAFDSVAKHD